MASAVLSQHTKPKLAKPITKPKSKMDDSHQTHQSNTESMPVSSAQLRRLVEELRQENEELLRELDASRLDADSIQLPLVLVADNLAMSPESITSIELRKIDESNQMLLINSIEVESFNWRQESGNQKFKELVGTINKLKTDRAAKKEQIQSGELLIPSENMSKNKFE